MDAPLPDGLVKAWEDFLQLDLPSGQDVYPELFSHGLLFPLQREREMARMIQLARTHSPRVVLDIGSDKGGGVWAWLKAIPSIRRMVVCEIRGTPYQEAFERAFPKVEFLWLPSSSYAYETVASIKAWLDGEKFDVAFLDGDKGEFLRDFDVYRPHVRRGGVMFMHDVVDPTPNLAWRAVKRRGYRVDHIRDLTESYAAIEREEAGEPPAHAHEAWLRHWRGGSCTVGVIYID